MKTLLKLESLALLLLGLYAFYSTGLSWWWFFALILAPDLSMLGYLLGPKWGAITYNLFHHYALAIGCYLLGNLLQVEWLTLCGVILFSHSALDRALGYGLKYKDQFKHTHLGWIGKSST